MQTIGIIAAIGALALGAPALADHELEGRDIARGEVL